jgi:hypothetical protein
MARIQTTANPMVTVRNEVFYTRLTDAVRLELVRMFSAGSDAAYDNVNKVSLRHTYGSNLREHVLSKPTTDLRPVLFQVAD